MKKENTNSNTKLTIDNSQLTINKQGWECGVLGGVAKKARVEIEKQTGKPVVADKSAHSLLDKPPTNDK